MEKKRAVRSVLRDCQLRSTVSDLAPGFEIQQALLPDEAACENSDGRTGGHSPAAGRRLLPNTTMAHGGTGPESEPDVTDRVWMRLGTGLFLKHHRMGRSPRSTTDDPSTVMSTSPEPEDKPPGLFAPRNDLTASWELLTSSWFNLLLLCIPFGLSIDYFHEHLHCPAKPATWAFTLCFIGIIPLALILGELTEDLATRFGDVVGGLINATFGNVVELMIGIFALRRDLYDVVAMSMLGSILSNLLLVLGCCFFFGGLRYPVQQFNQMTNRASNALLFLSCIALTMPTMSELFNSKYWHMDQAELLLLTRASCVVLVCIYVLYLVFQLYTHHKLFRDADDDEEDEAPNMSLSGAVLLLAVVTAFVALCSERLTSALETITDGGTGRVFLSIVLLPVAGNACEHLTAVIVAMKNKMDLALGVAIGSSIQIAVFALPVCVLVAWAMGKPFVLDSRNVDPFGLLALTSAVIHCCFVTNDATSHWMMGAQLLATYVLFSIAFLFR